MASARLLPSSHERDHDAPNRPFNVDPILTAVAVGYRNPDYTLIASQVLPYVPVPEERFKYTVYPISESFNVPEDLQVGRMGQVTRVEFTAKQETGEVDDWGVDNVVPQTDIDAAMRQRVAGVGLYDPRARAVEGLSPTSSVIPSPASSGSPIRGPDFGAVPGGSPTARA